MKKSQKTPEQMMMLGLGWWNLYFIIKLALFSQGTIGFHPIENFAFVIYLLIPLRHKLLTLIRAIAAFPIAFYLGHYDSFLPPLNRLWGQMSGLMDFQLSYLLELASRFVSLQDLLAIAVLIFAYYFLNRIFRVSIFVIAAMIYFSLPKPSPQQAVVPIAAAPALVRLLRASCGQEPHEALFSDPPSQQCYLFDNLAKLGYGENLMLNHNGSFDNFTGLLKNEGHLQAPVMSKEGLSPYQAAFDGSDIYRDKDILNRWLTNREKDPQEKVVALYNTISLHDGNRIIKNSGETGMVSYKRRLKNLLDDLYTFFDTLKKSERNIVVVLVPEHGAGMRGDRMQISGMREIPAATIVHTPVAMKIFGPNMKRTGETYHVKAPSSYLAISTLVSRLLEQDIYAKGTFDPKALSEALPKTKMVAQNSGSTVLEYNNKPYVSLDDQTWQEYPQ
ncbi:cellulose biosynthesis protein BcsG [Vibrio casei]|uniref:cellulose biosynthesis protein BcsG n=1 Tax=Vibrio casei TaxID=673372 RepID=UPI003F9939EE